MSSDLNRVTLSGRLTRDVELRSLNTGTYVARFTLASNKSVKKNDEWKDVPGFYDCVVFGKKAEVMSKHLIKGQRIGVDGKLNFSSWENQEGKKQSRVEIYVEDFIFLESKKSDKPESVADSFSGQSVDASDSPFSDPFMDDVPF